MSKWPADQAAIAVLSNAQRLMSSPTQSLRLLCLPAALQGPQPLLRL